MANVPGTRGRGAAYSYQTLYSLALEVMAMRDAHRPHPSVAIRVNGQVRKLPFDQAFALAHDLAATERVADATRLLARLVQVQPQDRPCRLLLAAARARGGDFAACLGELQELPGDLERQGGELHPALVFAGIGMWEGAWTEMRDFLRIQTRWPTAWLLFGDLCQRTRKRRIAAEAYQAAVGASARLTHVRACASRCLDALRGSPNAN